ncbi:MAG: hypothetical protein LBC73_08035 [Oscillospiraceae bacterium]|jgi:hypothetical protein|nr:hypothetical protein [Oscillospiraceae bacterium]
MMNAQGIPLVSGEITGRIIVNDVDQMEMPLHEQEDLRPEIDDIVCQYLDGDTLKDALTFIDYIRSNKMKIKWYRVNVWSVMYKNKRVLDIILNNNSWNVRLIYDHVGSRKGFTHFDVEKIKRVVGKMKCEMPYQQQPIFALS